MKRMRVVSGECEHGGDMEAMVRDVSALGLKVVDVKVNYDAEAMQITVEYDETKTSSTEVHAKLDSVLFL